MATGSNPGSCDKYASVLPDYLTEAFEIADAGLQGVNDLSSASTSAYSSFSLAQTFAALFGVDSFEMGKQLELGADDMNLVINAGQQAVIDSVKGNT